MYVDRVERGKGRRVVYSKTECRIGSGEDRVGMPLEYRYFLRVSTSRGRDGMDVDGLDARCPSA